MSSRRQGSIPLGGRYRQVSLYQIFQESNKKKQAEWKPVESIPIYLPVPSCLNIAIWKDSGTGTNPPGTSLHCDNGAWACFPAQSCAVSKPWDWMPSWHNRIAMKLLGALAALLWRRMSNFRATEPLLINPSTSYMRQWTVSALIQVMACAILDIWTLRNKLQWNSDQSTKLFISDWNALENIVCELAAILPRGRWVNPYLSASRLRNLAVRRLMVQWIDALDIALLVKTRFKSLIRSTPLPWSQERNDTPDHRQLDCLFNSLFRLTNKQSKFSVTGVLEEIIGHRWILLRKGQ